MRPILLFFVAAAGAALLAVSGSDPIWRLGAEASLRPSPDTAELSGLLTAGTPVTVLERREGWARVRVEGWVSSDVLAPSGTPPTPPTLSSVPAPAPSAAAPEGHAGGIEGVLSLRRGRLRKIRGAGQTLWLVPSGVDLNAGHAAGTVEERQRLATLESRARELEKAAGAAMQGDSLMDSMSEADRLRAERAEVLAERRDIVAALHGRREARVRETAARSTVADSSGWFAFPQVPPGSYTLYSRLTRDDVDVEWVRQVTVGPDTVRVDLDETNAVSVDD